MALLENFNDFRDLKGLPKEALPDLCEELRQRIIGVVMNNGGHLASSLGAVELIVSLLRVFDPGNDRIVFDVGHQSYAYKILTGRDDTFNTLRTWGGLSGFPKARESVYDHFDVGHSSTSISAALGYAKARDLRGENHEVLAVIGDGALLNGMAFEALNNIKSTGSKLTVVLNDNEWSINHRVGGFADYLAYLRANPAYLGFKRLIKRGCRRLPRGEGFEGFLAKVRDQVRGVLQPANFFEDLGISYWGPFDGHDVSEMEGIFRLSRSVEEPVLIHVVTQKGKGYYPAEQNPAKFHGVSCKKSVIPKRVSKADPPPLSWSAAAASIIMEWAEKDSRVVCLTAAMMEGSKLNDFCQAFPDRFFDVGISEEHLLTFSAGLAAGGLRPVATIYSTFLQRAMDQLVEDIAMQGHPVIVAVDRAGLVGEDGETHHGLFDVNWARAIPGLTIMAPRDSVDLRQMFRFAFERNEPVLIRYPRGKAPERMGREEEVAAGAYGAGEFLFPGSKQCLLGYGSTIPLLLQTREKCVEQKIDPPAVVDLRFLKPLDWGLIRAVVGEFEEVITVEESYLNSGLGREIAAFVNRENATCRVVNLGIDDRFIPHGTQELQWESCGLTVEHIMEVLSENGQKASG